MTLKSILKWKILSYCHFRNFVTFNLVILLFFVISIHHPAFYNTKFHDTVSWVVSLGNIVSWGRFYGGIKQFLWRKISKILQKIFYWDRICNFSQAKQILCSVCIGAYQLRAAVTPFLTVYGWDKAVATYKNITQKIQLYVQ